MASKSFCLSAVLPEVFLSCLQPKADHNFVARGIASVQDRNATQIYLLGNLYYQQGSIKRTLPGDIRLQVSNSLGLQIIHSGRKYVLCYQIASSIAFTVITHSHNIQVPYHSTLNTVTHNYHLPHFPAHPPPMEGI